jgi:hypothetical protein
MADARRLIVTVRIHCRTHRVRVSKDGQWRILNLPGSSIVQLLMLLSQRLQLLNLRRYARCYKRRVKGFITSEEGLR